MTNSSARQKLGQLGEDLAAGHFERLGYQLLERNFRTREGEIDLIVCNDDTLVFCEVKTRRYGSGKPIDAIRYGKQLQVRRMAARWLQQVHDVYRANLRQDAIGVVLATNGELIELEHLEAAF